MEEEKDRLREEKRLSQGHPAEWQSWDLDRGLWLHCRSDCVCLPPPLFFPWNLSDEVQPFRMDALGCLWKFLALEQCSSHLPRGPLHAA